MRRNDAGMGVNPKGAASGSIGNRSVATPTANVASPREGAGRLFINGRRVLMTSTIADAEMTDSRNQPVRN